MKILYGIQTTGNGHINRSREVIRELKRSGHEVQVVFSGRGHNRFMDIEEFEPFTRYPGLTFETHRGKLRPLKTAVNLNLWQYFQDILSFDASGYELVITDFEPITARIAKRNCIPCIGLAHQYAFAYDIPIANSSPLEWLVIRNFAPADFLVGLHFYHFDHPILPPIIPCFDNSKTSTIRDKILVYLPFEHIGDIISLLRPLKTHQFFIYHDLDKPDDVENLHLRPYSRKRFLKDLTECAGIVSNAGFVLIAEALNLGKKILVKPLTGQMEQNSNALAISALKLGTVMKGLDRRSVLKFLDEPANLPLEYPNVARMIVRWIESGDWQDVEGLAKEAWSWTDLTFTQRCNIRNFG
ncbi:MAG: glycosyltransferase family protein [Desulfobacterales bacterium]|jgi:uncharacterized protein (TIGR00661 family)